LDRRAIDIVCILEPFEMNECACDWCQLRGSLWTLVGVIGDERFIDSPGTFFLSDKLEYFSEAQLTFELVTSIIASLRSICSSVFEFRDGFSVTAREREDFSKLMTNCASFWSL